MDTKKLNDVLGQLKQELQTPHNECDAKLIQKVVDDLQRLLESANPTRFFMPPDKSAGI